MGLINYKAICAFCICLYSFNVFSQSTPDFNVNRSMGKTGLFNDPFEIIVGSNNSKLSSPNEAFSQNKEFSKIHNKKTPTNGIWLNNGPYGMGNCYTVCVGQSEGNIILAGTTRGIVRSTDGGNNWQFIEVLEIPGGPMVQFHVLSRIL